MEYKKFQGIELSRLGMGNMRLPVQKDVPGTPIDYVKAQEIIDYAMANGINYFDTAYIYHNGESEKFLGEAMKKYERSSYHLATKYMIQANPDYKAVFEEQLSRLQTNYIDFYLIHGINDQTAKQYIESGSVQYFVEQKEKGRIKYLGFSSHASVKCLEEFASYRDWDFAQIQLNYFDWQNGNTKKEYEILEQRHIPIVVMEPVRGGHLAALTEESEAGLRELHSDWSMAAWAFRFVKSLPQVQVILSGMSTYEQIVENIATFNDNSMLNEEEKEALFKACELFHKQLVVPCTSCRYCCPDCPMEINIPEYLKVYNTYRVEGPWALGRAKGIQSTGKPADCIGCGSCSGRCPQGINIPDIMQKLAEVLK